MKRVKWIIGIVFAIILIASGLGHFATPEMYEPLIFDFLPKTAINYLVGAIELILGIGVLIPKLRNTALTGIFFLMIAFLPVHIWDALKVEPFIGTKPVAYVRIAVQLLLIYLAWFAKLKK